MASTGDRLRAARELRRLSQAELAKLVGVSRTTIVNWETNLHPPRHIARLRELLNLDEHLLPRNSPEATSYADMDDHELAKRMTTLVSQLSAVAAEVTHRLLARDTPPSDEDVARPAARRGRLVLDRVEDLEGRAADDHRAGGAFGAL